MECEEVGFGDRQTETDRRTGGRRDLLVVLARKVSHTTILTATHALVGCCGVWGGETS